MSLSFSESVALFVDKKAFKNVKEVRDGALKKGLGKDGVIGASPVDTTRFESNWITTLNAPSSQSSLLQDDAVTAIRDLHSTIDSATLEDTIFMTNNVDYGPGLEYGNSKQAPQGMMRINVAKIPRYLEQESQIVNK